MTCTTENLSRVEQRNNSRAVELISETAGQLRATEVMPDDGTSCQELPPATSAINTVAGYSNKSTLRTTKVKQTNYMRLGIWIYHHSGCVRIQLYKMLCDDRSSRITGKLEIQVIIA